jgi:hypothetical protein
MKKHLLIFTLLVFSAFLLAGGASALTLTFTDSAVPLTISVSGSGGFVTYSTGTSTLPGSTWKVNATGYSNPVIGSAGDAALDLSSLDATSTKAGTLIVTLSDTFTLPFSNATYPSIADLMTIGGTITSSGTQTVTYVKWEGTAEFDQTNEIGTLSFTSPPPSFNGSLNGLFPNPGAGVTFSMTEIVTITDAASGHTSFNATDDATVPEPATMLLLGSGLLGMGVYARRRFAKK